MGLQHRTFFLSFLAISNFKMTWTSNLNNILVGMYYFMYWSIGIQDWATIVCVKPVFWRNYSKTYWGSRFCLTWRFGAWRRGGGGVGATCFWFLRLCNEYLFSKLAFVLFALAFGLYTYVMSIHTQHVKCGRTLTSWVTILTKILLVDETLCDL